MTSRCPECGAETEGKRSYKMCADCSRDVYRLWCERNKDKIKGYYVKNYAKNRETNRAYQKTWRDKNNERLKEYWKQTYYTTKWKEKAEQKVQSTKKTENSPSP